MVCGRAVSVESICCDTCDTSGVARLGRQGVNEPRQADRSVPMAPFDPEPPKRHGMLSALLNQIAKGRREFYVYPATPSIWHHSSGEPRKVGVVRLTSEGATQKLSLLVSIREVTRRGATRNYHDTPSKRDYYAIHIGEVLHERRTKV